MDTLQDNARAVLDQMTVLQWTQEASLKYDFYEADDRHLQTEDVIGTIERVQSLTAQHNGVTGDILADTALAAKLTSLRTGESLPPASGDAAAFPTRDAAHFTPEGFLVSQGAGNQGWATQVPEPEGGTLISAPTLTANTYIPLEAPLLAREGDISSPPQTPPATNPPGDTPPTNHPPTDHPPTDVPPTDGPPTDTPPTDTPPTDTPPTDDPGDDPCGHTPCDPQDPTDPHGPCDPHNPGDPCDPTPPTDGDCGCGTPHLIADVNAVVQVAIGALPDLLCQPLLEVDGGLTPILNIDLGNGHCLPDHLGLDLGLTQTLDTTLLNTLNLQDTISALVQLDTPLTLCGLIHEGIALGADIDVALGSSLDFAHTQTAFLLADVNATIDVCASECIGAALDTTIDTANQLVTSLGLEEATEATAAVHAAATAALCLTAGIAADAAAHVDTVFDIAAEGGALLSTALDLDATLSLQDGLHLNTDSLVSAHAALQGIVGNTTDLGLDSVGDATVKAHIFAEAVADAGLGAVAGIAQQAGLTAVADLAAAADAHADTALALLSDTHASLDAAATNTLTAALDITASLDHALSVDAILSPTDGMSLSTLQDLTFDGVVNGGVTGAAEAAATLVAETGTSLHAIIDATAAAALDTVADIATSAGLGGLANAFADTDATVDTTTDIAFGILAQADLTGQLSGEIPNGELFSLGGLQEQLQQAACDPSQLLPILTGQLPEDPLAAGLQHDILSGGMTGIVANIVPDADSLLGLNGAGSLLPPLLPGAGEPNETCSGGDALAIVDSTLGQVATLTNANALESLLSADSIHWNDGVLGGIPSSCGNGWVDTISGTDGLASLQTAVIDPLVSWLGATVSPAADAAAGIADCAVPDCHANDNNLLTAITGTASNLVDTTLNSLSPTCTQPTQSSQPVANTLAALGNGLKSGFGW